MRNVKRHLVATASMLAGGSAVVGLVFLMNELNEPPEPETSDKKTAFKVEKKKPPKKPKRKRPRRRKSVKTSRAPVAPTPNLAANLSGVSFDLPGFQTADFEETTKKLLGDTSKRTAMTADTVDEPPKPRRRVPPRYPEKARQRGIEGYVNLKVKIDTSGNVERVRVVQAKPKGIFEDPAISTVKQWQFAPAMYEGKPVSIWVELPLRFALN